MGRKNKNKGKESTTAIDKDENQRSESIQTEVSEKDKSDVIPENEQQSKLSKPVEIPDNIKDRKSEKTMGKPSVEEPAKKIGKEEGSQANEANVGQPGMEEEIQGKEREKSRIVFVATACHYCKAVPDNINVKLSLCAGCRMINYCSRQHQIADWKAHKPICNLIDKVLKAEQKTNLYDRCKENLSQTEWLQVRYGYMQLFRDQLGRELHPYEKELLLFPRVCRTCRLANSLQTCTICNMSSFCVNHDTLKVHEWCSDLKVWLDLVRWESENGLVRSSKGPEATLKISNILSDFPPDIQSFFQKQPLPKDFKNDAGGVWLAGITDVATVPLTIIWTLKQFASQLLTAQSLTVHLIGAEMDFEGCCAAKWETCFLHLLHNLKKLNVILIGPELLSAPSKHTLCKKCEQKELQVVFEHHTGLMYHEYCDDSEPQQYLSPDIICAFNCGIYRSTGFDGEDSWAPTIPLLGKALLVTTAYTETECFQDIRRVTSECNILKVVGSCLKNPYRSLRPQRTLINEEIEPLMYKNQYVAVYKPII